MVAAPRSLRRRTLAAALLLLAAACRREAARDDAARSPPPARYVAVVPKAASSGPWAAVRAGAERAARAAGVALEWRAPPRDGDREQQVALVENFVARRVAGLVVAPLDAHALAGACRAAKRAGIPVVVVDSPVAWDGMASFVASDPRRGGALAADQLGGLLAGEGRVVVTGGLGDAATARERAAGFLDAMKAKFPAIEVVPSEEPAGAAAGAEGFFAPDEPATLAQLRALDAAGRSGKTKLVGCDASRPLVDALRTGRIHGLVVPDSTRMGELAVKALVDHLDGKSVEARIDPGFVVVTAENRDDPAVRALLAVDPAK